MEYTEKYIKSIFWIFGVWEYYLNDNMKEELNKLIEKIYRDWVIKWKRESKTDLLKICDWLETDISALNSKERDE